jgi:hypothetical protein
MSVTYTQSESQTFTVTNAKYIASKVQTDLLRLHRFYYDSHKEPTLKDIQEYHDELVLLQTYNYLDEIEYGFVVNDRWVKALKYTARQGGVITADDDPGRIKFNVISGSARFTSMLRYNANWRNATAYQKDTFRAENPVKRVSGQGYSGDWVQQSSYSSAGRGLLKSGI